MGLCGRTLGAPRSALPSSSCALPRKAVIRPAGVSRQARTEVFVLLSLFRHPSSGAEASVALCVGIRGKDPLQSVVCAGEVRLRKSTGEQSYITPDRHSKTSITT